MAIDGRLNAVRIGDHGSEFLNEPPHLAIIGVKNMWAVFMDHDAGVGIPFRVAVSCNMGAFVEHNRFAPRLGQLAGKARTGKTCPNNRVCVLHVSSDSVVRGFRQLS